MVIYLNLIGLCMVVLWRSLGLHGLRQDGRLHGGAQGQGTMGVAPMPASWQSSGGGSGGKTELPSLPNGASPLEFGHWLYLYGPIMSDLPHVAGKWWDATVRQAHAFWNGRDYVLYNVFNFAHAFLMNCWKAASPERSREALPCCSGQ